MVNQKSDRNWDSLSAIIAIEGDDCTPQEEVEAWAYLISTKKVWDLQGFYGRTARSLIDEGYIQEDGTINWDTFEELNS